jgi:enediyne biosynthesis protein E8
VTPVAAPVEGTIENRTMTLEAFADTIIPGEKRWPEDRAVAGAATGPGAVAAGAVELLETPAAGLVAGLDDLVQMLNKYALAHADTCDLTLDPAVPPFVALPFAERTALVRALTAPGHPEKDAWVSLALFSNMAFDTGAHMHTLDALAAGHPGMTTMGLAKPDSDGLWRFPQYSYGRRLADLHPHTTSSGSPA